MTTECRKKWAVGSGQAQERRGDKLGGARWEIRHRGGVVTAQDGGQEQKERRLGLWGAGDGG